MEGLKIVGQIDPKELAKRMDKRYGTGEYIKVLDARVKHEKKHRT